MNDVPVIVFAGETTNPIIRVRIRRPRHRAITELGRFFQQIQQAAEGLGQMAVTIGDAFRVCAAGLAPAFVATFGVVADDRCVDLLDPFERRLVGLDEDRSRRLDDYTDRLLGAS